MDMILTSNGQPTIKEGAFSSTNRQTTTDSVRAAIVLPRVVRFAGRRPCSAHRLIAALCRRSPCSTTPHSRALSTASQASSAQVQRRRPPPNAASRTAAPRWIIPVNVRKERAGGGHSIGDASIAAT